MLSHTTLANDSESSRREDELSDSNEDSASSSASYDSDEDESLSEEEEQLLLKPVFVSKSKRQQDQTATPTPTHVDATTTTNTTTTIPSKDVTISKLENLTKDQEKLDVSNHSNDNNFDGIDDTDDINPEEEYNAWKLRELSRYNRDQLLLQQQDAILDDKVRRSDLNESELIEEYNHRKQDNDKSNPTATVTTSNKFYHKGAFYHDNNDIQQKFLKRNYTADDNETVHDDNDHDDDKHLSRPTKLKFKKIA